MLASLWEQLKCELGSQKTGYNVNPFHRTIKRCKIKGHAMTFVFFLIPF